jgi:UDP-N-acetylglucosamine diphosphorylase / glucose-1-phosphate thymidylyltransferase / UDP-N-acetylgalactosamine diphosphorylase / glucosamine-1-phosphate N-acetyltransferase / galactosamine-1-phosphate N-acetyltransferase
MKYIVFTHKDIDTGNLYPFTLTRRVQDIRIGILTIREKWQIITGIPAYNLLNEDDFPANLNPTIPIKNIPEDAIFFFIKANVLPSNKIVALLATLQPGEAIADNYKNVLIQAVNKKQVDENGNIHPPKIISIIQDVVTIKFSWEIFLQNRDALLEDYELITTGKNSSPLDSSNRVSNPKNIFVEEGAVVKYAIINADEGPVYIAKDTLVMESVCLRGPISIGEGAVVKMGATLYGATTIGPYCVVGGEIKNSVLFAHSNKAHHGYLGDSVIGEWCNLGAGTSNSNLKNTAGNINVHLQQQKHTVGLKCGMLMGDFSRTAINTSINSGTVIGVSCNVFGAGLTPTHLPSFSWGMNGSEIYKLEKAMVDAANWKKLKNKEFTENEKLIFTNIYKQIKES